MSGSSLHKFDASHRHRPRLWRDPKNAPKKFIPAVMRQWVVFGSCCTMILLAACLEVALMFSNKRGGFAVPEKNVFKFISQSFLSTIPIVLIAPLVFLWDAIDFSLRWYQPYVTLSRGQASAQEGLLQNYVVNNQLTAVYFSMRHRHWIILISAITTIMANTFQPLAGATLEIRQLPSTRFTLATITSQVGLAPDINKLDVFVAAAGFTEAATMYDLNDPPFILGNWASSTFTTAADDSSVLNGSVSLRTAGIGTIVNCANPTTNSLNLLFQQDTGNYTLSATSQEGCTQNVTFDAASSEQQYGIVNVPNCGAQRPSVAFEPVLFWYFLSQQPGAGTGTARAVFCDPQIHIENITVTIALNNRSLTSITSESGYLPMDNITGLPLSGFSYNGVMFEPSNDTFIQARATFTRSSIPEAIFRLAKMLPEGLQSALDDNDQFLNLTTLVYSKYLTTVAQSIYFLPDNQLEVAELTSLVPKLRVVPIPTHALACFLALIGLVGIVIHAIHLNGRRKIELTAPPGSIAAIVALTARSGFGECLDPFDSAETIDKKLGGMTFSLDKLSGAIVVDQGQVVEKVWSDTDSQLTLLARGA